MNSLERMRKFGMSELELDNYILSCVIALLTEPLGFDANGNVPKSLVNSDTAIKFALEVAQNKHAWVVCGPVEDGFELLKKDVATWNFKPGGKG